MSVSQRVAWPIAKRLPDFPLNARIMQINEHGGHHIQPERVLRFNQYQVGMTVGQYLDRVVELSRTKQLTSKRYGNDRMARLWAMYDLKYDKVQKFIVIREELSTAQFWGG